MNISLNIEASSPEEILAAIKELAAAGVVHTSAKESGTESKKNTSPRNNKPAAPAKAAEPDPGDTAEPKEDGNTPIEETAEISSVTEIKEAAVEKGKTPEGKAAIKKLLTEFESPSISAIPEDKRAAFLAE